MGLRARIWLACLVFAVLIFSFDLYLPLGVATGAFYVIVVLITVQLTHRWDTTTAAGICSLLMLVGAALSPRYGEDSIQLTYAIVNTSVSLIAVWATAYATIRFRGSQEELASLNRELEDRVERRSADVRQRAAELMEANESLEREIAQREAAERDARDSQAVYASLVEDLPIPIIRKDKEGKFVFANQAFCSWVGRSRKEVVEHTDLDFAPAALAEKYRRDDETVIKTGELFLDVEKNEHGGTVNWVHVIKTPARDGLGKIVGTQAIFWDVTAKREAEERLRESETLYHSLVDTLPVCLLRKDIDGVYTFVNKQACEFFAITPDDLLFKTDFDFFPKELAQQYRDGDLRVLNTGEIYSDTEQITLPDESRRHIEVIKAPVRDAQDVLAGVQVIFRDVTEELQLEVALKESEQRLQAVLDNTSAVVYIKDADGKYLLINREYEKLFDLTLQGTIGKTDFDLFPEEYAEAFRRVDKQVIECGQPLEIEEVAPQADGLHYYVSSKFPLRDDQGNVFAIAGISTDITSLKRAEEQLRESQYRLNLALGSAEIGAWSWDLESGELFWDDRMHDIFGLPRGAFGDTSEAFLACLHEGDKARFRGALQDCINHANDDLDIDFRVRWPEGIIHHVTCRGAALVGEQGQAARLTGVCLDITERKRAEQQLKQYASKLEATNRELEEFAYIVSHDLQEPLRTLQFFSDSLQADLGDQLSDQPKRDLQFIAEAAERMQQLVRALLAWSRAGRAEMKRDRVALNTCVEDAVTALSNRIRETNADINVSELPAVYGDQSMLTQLFQNLIGNALKFVPEGKTPQVSVSANVSDSKCLICVSDNGIGIKEDYAQKIFSPFQRLHATSEYEGTGIGLSICRKVVQRHGGNIWVQSQPDAGSQFFFELPPARNGA